MLKRLNNGGAKSFDARLDAFAQAGKNLIGRFIRTPGVEGVGVLSESFDIVQHSLAFIGYLAHGAIAAWLRSGLLIAETT